VNQVSITYRLIAESGVLVGSTSHILSVGLDKSTIRRRRIAGGATGLAEVLQPIIPGSQVKGKVRNECERILGNIVEICRSPFPETMCPHSAAVANPPCSVCRIFGSSNHKSRLFFGDARATAHDSLAPFLTRVQAGVSLSRKRRTAQDERLYHIERAKEGLEYVGRIDGYLDDDFVEEQLAIVSSSLRNIIAFGGSKSRGAGWSRVEIVEVSIDDRKLRDKEELDALQAKGLRRWRGLE
jgi:CRISPR/Cas system CSM-associated protein Csm3 (group 7 of RAMP superfamily)